MMEWSMTSEQSSGGAEAPRVRSGDRVRQSERIATRVVGGKALVVVIDRSRLHTLNAVGTFVWERCDGRTVGELADAVAAHWRIARERALRDVAAFVSELADAGALQVEPQEGAA